IGRTSWKGRGKISVVGGSFKKTTKTGISGLVFAAQMGAYFAQSSRGIRDGGRRQVGHAGQRIAVLLTPRLRCYFFQAEDGIRDWSVTGVQTCALPILIAAAPWLMRVLAPGLGPQYF